TLLYGGQVASARRGRYRVGAGDRQADRRNAFRNDRGPERRRRRRRAADRTSPLDPGKEKALLHADARAGEAFASTRRGKARRKSSTVGCGKVAGSWRKLPAAYTLADEEADRR